MLIILGGLPGSGKTTIGKQLAKHLKAVYLRVDTVEQVLQQINQASGSPGPEGYMICYAIAAENLKLGQYVIADSVNSIQVTRDDWQQVAKEAEVKYIEIELVCSDTPTHKNRVTTRKADLSGHRLPSWQEVANRDYEPWETKTLSVDTFKYSVDESVQIILDCIRKMAVG
jgi:predicted kinase